MTRGPIARPSLNASRAPQFYVISFKNARSQLLFITFRIPQHCSSSRSSLCVLSSHLKSSSTQSLKGMIFLLRWLFLLTFYLNITSWVCLFSSHSHFPSSFLCFPLFSISHVGRVFPRVSSPFSPYPHLLNPFSSSFFSFPQWRVLKRLPTLHLRGSTTKLYNLGPLMSCSMSAQA